MPERVSKGRLSLWKRLWKRTSAGSFRADDRRSWFPNEGLRVAVTARDGARAARRGWMAGLYLLLCCPGLVAAVPGEAAELPEVGGGSLLIKMQSGYRIATRISSDVSVEVTGLTARTTLRQEFVNDGSEWVEGVYVFPLPPDAAVDRMRLRIGDRLIEGEVREKASAEATYEAAKQAGKRASLVRQQRQNLFTTLVANIGPGETVAVEVGYLDTVRFDEGTFSLRIPMTLTPRYIPGNPLPDRQGSGWAADTDRVPDASLITPPMIAASEDHRVSLSARINAGMPLELIASRYHPVDVDDSGEHYRLGFALQGVPMDHDIELIWRPVKTSRPAAMLFSEVVEDEPHLLIMLMPPNTDVDDGPRPARDLVFVIDTSGSMHGVSIEQARKALSLALEGLRPEDRFNVIQFNAVTRSLFGSSVPANAANIGRARRFVNGLIAEGGTEMRPALERALEAGPGDGYLRQVVFITDGSVGNESELIDVLSERLGTTRLFTVGIGSAPNRFFMQRAAELGRGTSITISALHEVEERMQRLIRKIEKPRVTDIRVRWPGGIVPEAYPSRIPDLYAGEPVVIKARLAQPPRPGDRLVIEGQHAGGDWRAELSLDEGVEGSGIAAIWARAHIGALLDRERRSDDRQDIRSRVVSTALRHHLVSRYTSFVAVDRTPARPAADPLVSEHLPNLLPYGQSTRAIFGFPATATVAAVHRRNGALFLGLAVLLLFYQVWTLRGRGRGDD